MPHPQLPVEHPTWYPASWCRRHRASPHPHSVRNTSIPTSQDSIIPGPSAGQVGQTNTRTCHLESSSIPGLREYQHPWCAGYRAPASLIHPAEGRVKLSPEENDFPDLPDDIQKSTARIFIEDLEIKCNMNNYIIWKVRSTSRE